jgi:GTP pyrophosphokinase
MEFNRLLEKAREYLPPEKLAVVEEAYKFAAEKHKGQVRLSTDPFIEHPVQTAYILAELQLDSSSLAAALLHDIPEETGLPIADISAKFGPEIAKLVDGVTKLGKVSLTTTSGAPASASQAENLRKMLVAMAEDLRVVFIKLADRLHNMRTLNHLPKDRQLRNAQETMDIYAPLAHRLGIWELKWQLEDLSFQYLKPQEHARIARLVDLGRPQREKFINRAIELLKKEFDRAGLAADISGRPKHLYSIYQKMEKYAATGRDFGDIYDLLALRVLVSKDECYNAMGIIHNLWRPLPNTFDDYISNPKPNGYQALHTAVMCLGTTRLEIQIRSREMHQVSEYGAAAHWSYKSGGKIDMQYEERLAWLRQLIEWHRELSGAEEFLESVKTDIFIDQVFVYTPTGEIKDLPRGSTPLDFAYRVHTDLGHRCVGAKINGKLEPFSYELKNGDIVEIISSKAPRGPSLDWLNPNLGYVRTSHARSKIRQWFNKQERTENIERGKQILDKELRRLAIKTERQALAELFEYKSLDDFLAAVGAGTISSHQIVLKLAAQEEKALEIAEVTAPSATGSSVQVLGVGDLMTNIAQCCHPVPGDKIIGYITRSRGVSIHRQDCHNIVNEDEKERLIPVDWGQGDHFYPVGIQVEAWDRVGLMRDVTTVVAEEKVNITSVNLADSDGQNVTMFLTLETKGLAQLSQILKKIDGVKGVLSVSRVGVEPIGKGAAMAPSPPTGNKAKKQTEVNLGK